MAKFLRPSLRHRGIQNVAVAERGHLPTLSKREPWLQARSSLLQRPPAKPLPSHRAGDPETAWADRNNMLERIALVARCDGFSAFDAEGVGRLVGELRPTLGLEVESLLPLFANLGVIKNVRSMAREREHSLKAQKQAAEHAVRHLEDTVAALEAHLRDPLRRSADSAPGEVLCSRLLGLTSGMRVSPPYSAVGGLSGLVDRIKVRYDAQARTLREEGFRASALLKEIGGGDLASFRVVEVVIADRERLLQQKVSAVLEGLGARSLRVLMEDRATAERQEAAAAGWEAAREAVAVTEGATGGSAA